MIWRNEGRLQRGKYNKAKKKLKKANIIQENNTHTFYKKNFNYVDIFDKKLSYNNYNYKVKNWRAKLLLYMLKIMMNNIHTLIKEFNDISTLNFKLSIIKWVVSLNKKPLSKK